MRAVCWRGSREVAVESVPEPQALRPRDAIVKVSRAAICGSDLHLYNGRVPGLRRGDILGHEFMGEVVAAGRDSGRRVGERVVVPFTIACGACWFCRNELWALCDDTNPNARAAEDAHGFSGAGMFGFSHLHGGYAGGQAEFVRVPYADVGPLPVPEEVSDDQALFLGDLLPTGYQAVEQCEIRPDDIVAVWGCGPVGLMAMRCAWLFGAGRVIGIDGVPERLARARDFAHAETVSFPGRDVVEELREMTGGRGPDACIDAVGMEAHGIAPDGAGEGGAARFRALREAIQACRKGGTVSIPGVYAGVVDGFPLGAAFAKGVTLRMGQTHVQRYMRPLLERIRRGDLDPSRLITHRVRLDDAPAAYAAFNERRDGCIKVVLQP